MLSEIIASRRALLAEATATLRDAGIANPRAEAVRLWQELTSEGATARILEPDAPTDPPSAGGFRAGVARRARGEPLAYVTGAVGFRMLSLGIDRRGLIPRPETEGLVDLLLSRVRLGRVADVGTGSGCLALALATEGSFTEVVGVDIDAGAIELARENRERVGARVHLMQGDLCQPLRREGFDALMSNPPYLTLEEYAALDAGVREWEPRSALVSGLDGLEATHRLLDQGRWVLREGGSIALEIDCNRAADCARRATALGWADVAIHADLFGRERYLLARRSETP
jgi:release factor glutamine methyltransferase